MTTIHLSMAVLLGLGIGGLIVVAFALTGYALRK